MSVILRGGNYGTPTMGMSGGNEHNMPGMSMSGGQRKKKGMRGGQCSGPTNGGNASPMGMGMSGGGKMEPYTPAQVGGRRRRTGKVRRHRTKSYRSKGKKTQRRRK
jgi:hypothetical protein